MDQLLVMAPGVVFAYDALVRSDDTGKAGYRRPEPVRREPERDTKTDEGRNCGPAQGALI